MDISQKILEVSRGRVLSGPFRSMLLDPRATSWGDGDILRKLLGVYEEELHHAINKTIASSPGRVVNVGCAEGYYAVGMSMRLPGTEVIAVDKSAKARECTAKNASLNGSPTIVSESCPGPMPSDFWLIDIEGGERRMLSDPKRWAGVEMLVELHEWKNRNIKEVFGRDFSESHNIETIRQGSRNPNKFDFLSEFSDRDRWMLMSESRPEIMSWMWLSPKTGRARAGGEGATAANEEQGSSGTSTRNPAEQMTQELLGT